MPLYDFTCEACGNRFEALLGADAASGSPPCPACGSGATRRVYSAFAGPFTVRPRGAAARRSDATRRDREVQRAERREERRRARDSGGGAGGSSGGSAGSGGGSGGAGPEAGG